jgi:hypothetical protein
MQMNSTVFAHKMPEKMGDLRTFLLERFLPDV